MTDIVTDFGSPSPRSWSGSVKAPVRFVPMPKLQATRLFHRALKRINVDQIRRAWAKPNGRRTPPHTVERVLRALVFDFLNYRTGRLDPGYAAIAQAAGCSLRTAKRALAYLKALKIVGWIRRCYSWNGPDGRFQLEQDTNAYWLNSPESWGDVYTSVSPPSPDLWGSQLPLPAIFNPAPGTSLQDLAASAPAATTVEDYVLTLEMQAALLESGGNRIYARHKRRMAQELRLIDALVRLARALARPSTIH